MAPNMALASRNCFVKSSLVIDRFHVVRLVCDAMQHLRKQLRWKVIDNENEAIKKLIYTTNKIEGYHRQIRKVTKTKGAFTSDIALLKLIYLATQNIQKKMDYAFSKLEYYSVAIKHHF